MSGSSPQLSFREQVHQMLRESILDAAWGRAAKSEWDVVRIADIARDVGVSRQTIYNEFGTKQQLAEAVFSREMTTFLEGILEEARAASTPQEAVRDSLKWMFHHAAAHEMLQRMLADARDGRSTALLPFLTTNSHLITRPLRHLLTELYVERWGGDPAYIERLVDFIVRMGISHIVLASDFTEEQVIEDITAIVLAVLKDQSQTGA